MTSREQASNKPHDLGGLPAGPVDREDHDLAYWERRIEAMISLCFAKGVLKDVAQLRKGIENLGPDAYETLSYYERWAASMAVLLQEAGVVTAAEIRQAMDSMDQQGSRT
jgi:mannitol/fructose-specific phosphotransferase system IIA component (Ntr-type)